MAGFLDSINPFSERENHPLWVYRTLSFASWLLLVFFTFWYSFHVPLDDKLPAGTIWGQNRVHFSPFALNQVITTIYWIVLFIAQIGYVWSLFSKNETHVKAAGGVGSHFIFNNLLLFAFVMLFVRGHFWWAEVILVVNFWNLSALYFRHPITPRFIHFPTVAGPLAFNFVALYWNGAIAVNSDSLPARIIANIAIWSILVYGFFFLAVYKDYMMGFSLSVLTAALGVGQFMDKMFALQWIFAFIIMAVLFLATLAIAIPGIFGKEIGVRRDTGVVEEDQERAPLLDDN